MTDDDLNPDHEAELDRIAAEIERETVRVGLDWELAAERMLASATHERVPFDDDTTGEPTLGLDMTLLLRTLRSLPDGAGTDRFLAAFVAA